MNTPQTVQRNALLSKFDVDPGPWRPMYYPLTIDVPLEANQSETGSVTINNQPFIFTFIGHQIIGNTGDPETSGLYQDGQYSIEFKDEQSNYQSGPIAAAASWGGPAVGYQIDLPLPIPFPGAKTLTFNITNHYTRILTPDPAEPVFQVKLTIGGIANWGSLL